MSFENFPPSFVVFQHWLTLQSRQWVEKQFLYKCHKMYIQTSEVISRGVAGSFQGAGGSHGAKKRFLKRFSCCFYHLL